jgi:hypothetical protein
LSASSEVGNGRVRRAGRRERLLPITNGGKPERRKSSRGQRPHSLLKKNESAEGTAGLVS